MNMKSCCSNGTGFIRKQELLKELETYRDYHHDLGELLQPLIRDIHLFDSFVAGTTHLKDLSVLEKKGSFTKISIGIYLIDF